MAELEGAPLTEELDVEDLEAIAKQSLSAVLADLKEWDDKANSTTSAIIDHALKSLAQLNRPYKYVVTVVLQQRNGAGMHAAASARWDSKKDLTVKVPWESSCCQALVTVFAVAINVSPQQSL